MKDRLFQFFGLTTAASLLAGCAFPDRTITPTPAQAEATLTNHVCQLPAEALSSMIKLQESLGECLPGIKVEKEWPNLTATDAEGNQLPATNYEVYVSAGGNKVVPALATCIEGKNGQASCSLVDINPADVTFPPSGYANPDANAVASCQVLGDVKASGLEFNEKGEATGRSDYPNHSILSACAIIGEDGRGVIGGQIAKQEAVIGGQSFTVKGADGKPVYEVTMGGQIALEGEVFQMFVPFTPTPENTPIVPQETPIPPTPKVEYTLDATGKLTATVMAPTEVVEPTPEPTQKPTEESKPTEKAVNPELGGEYTIAELEKWLDEGGREKMVEFAKEAVKNGEIAIQGTLPSPQNVRSLDYKGGDKWSTDEGTLSNGYSRLTTNTSIDGIVFGQVIKLNQSDSLDKKVEEEQLKVFKEINAFAHFVSVKDIITSGTGDPLLAVLVVLPISSNGEVSYVPSLMFLEREWRTPLVVIEGSRFVEKNFDEKELNKQVKSGDVFEFSLVETYNAKGMMGSQISFADNCQQWGIAKALGHFDDNGIIDKLRSGSLDVLGKLVKLMSSRITRK